MKLEELIDTLESADVIRIIKDGEDIFVGFLALFAPKIGHRECTIYKKYKNDKVVKFRVIPEIRHKRWRELNLTSPLEPDKTPDYEFSDLQMKLYYTIYL